jgi:cytochrome c oxidase subunit 2
MDENANTPTTQKSSFPVVPVIIIVVIVLGGLFFVMSRGNNTNTSTENTPQPTQQSVENAQTTVAPTQGEAMTAEGTTIPEESTGAVKNITVKGQNFSFVPSEIRVKKGDTVNITFDNTSGFHDFVLDEFNVKTKQIQGGSSETVTFTASKVGTFEYYCSVGNHRQMGMKGNLIVE